MAEIEMDDAQLAAALADLGRHVAHPAFADLRPRVMPRIGAPRPAPWWRRFASARYGLTPALVTLALLLVAVLASLPAVQATAAEILRLRGIEIFRGPVPTLSPSPTPMPSLPGSALDLGERVSLGGARLRAGFPILVPSDPILGAPDEVYLRTSGALTEVSLVYLRREGIPASPEAGVAAVVSEIGNATVESELFGKIVGPDTRIAPVTVNGGRGYWLEGHPHGFFYRQPSGSNFSEERLRLAGNTLIWEQGGLLLRVEAEVDEATALRIAASFHASTGQ